MIGNQRSLGQKRLRLLLVLVVILLPASLHAETIIIQNTLPAAIVVQASTIVRGQVNRAAPATLNPNDATPGIQMPGNKFITIYDAKAPNKVLYQGVIPAGNADLNLGIVMDPKTGKFKLEPMPAATPPPGK